MRRLSRILPSLVTLAAFAITAGMPLGARAACGPSKARHACCCKPSKAKAPKPAGRCCTMAAECAPALPATAPLAPAAPALATAPMTYAPPAIAPAPVPASFAPAPRPPRSPASPVLRI